MAQQPSPQEQIKQVLDFTDDEYETNTQGKLSTRQLEHFDKLLAKSMRDIRLLQIGLPSAVLALFFGFPYLLAPMNLTIQWSYSFLGLMIVGSIVLAIGIQYLINKQNRLDPSTKKDLITLDSFAYLTTSDAGSPTIALLSKQTTIKPELFQILQDGNVYRFHYSPYYDKFVSAKWFGHIRFQEIQQQLEARIQEHRQLANNIPPLMAEAWDFSSEDIEANRKGKLTQHQVKQFNERFINLQVGNQNNIAPNMTTPVEQVQGLYDPAYGLWDSSLVARDYLEIKIGSVRAVTHSQSQRMGLIGLNTQTVYTMYYVYDERFRHNRLVSIEM